jgi:Ger(x)C family germination protein
MGACSKFFPTPISIEKMEFCQAMSVDVVDGQFKLGVMLKSVKPSSKGTGEDSGDGGQDIFSESGNSLSTIVRDLQARRPKVIFFGDIEALLVSKNAIKDKFENIMDFFVRSRDFSEYSSIYAVEDDAFQMLKNMNKVGQSPVDIVIKSRLAKTKAFTDEVNFLNAIELLQPHSCGVLPIMVEINGENGSEFELKGFGVILNKSWVGVLDESQSRGLNVLKNNLKAAVLSFEIDDLDSKISIGLDSISAKTFIKPKKNNGKIEFDISVKLNASITEVSKSNALKAQELIDKCQSSLSQIVKQDIENCLNFAQQISADFVGLFQKYRLWHKTESDKIKPQWNDKFKDITINVKVNSVITRSHLVSIDS